MTDKANAPYPYLGINGEYISLEFLKSLENDLVQKLPMVQAGIVEFTPCEKFAYQVLKQIKMNDQWGFAPPQFI